MSCLSLHFPVISSFSFPCASNPVNVWESLEKITQRNPISTVWQVGFSGKQSARQKLASKALIRVPLRSPCGRQARCMIGRYGELSCSPSFFYDLTAALSWVLDAQWGQGKVSFMLTNESLGLGCLEGVWLWTRKFFFRQVEAVTKESTYKREHSWWPSAQWHMKYSDGTSGWLNSTYKDGWRHQSFPEAPWGGANTSEHISWKGLPRWR